MMLRSACQQLRPTMIRVTSCLPVSSRAQLPGRTASARVSPQASTPGPTSIPTTLFALLSASCTSAALLVEDSSEHRVFLGTYQARALSAGSGTRTGIVRMRCEASEAFDLSDVQGVSEVSSIVKVTRFPRTGRFRADRAGLSSGRGPGRCSERGSRGFAHCSERGPGESGRGPAHCSERGSRGFACCSGAGGRGSSAGGRGCERVLQGQ